MGGQRRNAASLLFSLLLILGLTAGCRPSESSPDIVTDSVPGPESIRNDPSPHVVSPAKARPRFKELTSRAGIDFHFRSGRSAGEYAIIESLGGGVAGFDYDLDGYLDLMFAGGGTLDDRTVRGLPSALYRNLGDWDFEDVTASAGTSADAFYSHGVYAADFNGDGFPDLAVSGYGGVQLFRNQGDGTFQEQGPWITDPQHPWSSGLAWADLDGDGHLDCYVAHYVDWSWDNHVLCPGPSGVPREVCAPREFRGVTDVIYFNDGEGGFRPLREKAGLMAGGKGLGVVAGDMNSDGHVDLYVANDTTDNFLYLNDGEGRFRETASLGGVSGDPTGVNTGSMGVDLQDLNHDGLPDLWVTNFERELFALYRNEGGGIFWHVSRAAGLAAIENLFVGFGTTLVDVDFDGHRDIVVANGHVSYHSPRSPFAQQPLLVLNQGDGRFRSADGGPYFSQPHTGRGLIHADLDNDGSWDLVFTHLDEPPALLQGQPPPQPDAALVTLVGRESDRDAIGTTVRFRTREGERLYLRNGGGSYLSSSDPRLRLTGLSAGHRNDPGSAESPSTPAVEVRWPSGFTQHFPFPDPDSQVLWIEGERPFVFGSISSRDTTLETP